MAWAAFGAGIVVGVIIGVVALCLLQINRDEKLTSCNLEKISLQ